MKKLFVFALAILAMVGRVRADEGMWLPMFVERLNYVDMQKMGLQLTPEELYSINRVCSSPTTTAAIAPSKSSAQWSTTT